MALETSWTCVCLTLGDEVTSTESVYVTSVASEESKIAIYAKGGEGGPDATPADLDSGFQS